MKRITKCAICFLLIAAMLVPFAGCRKKAANGQVWDKPEEATEPADLTLSISDDLFLADKQTVLEIRVACQEAVTEDVQITDETGAVIALLPNDGSGSLKTQIPFRRTDIGSGTFTASAGKYTSEPVEYEVQPEVTEEMVATLFETSQELGAFISERGFEDPYSDKAIKEIRKHLEKNENICSVEENNGILLYQTTDGLMGSYGMGRSEEGYAGFSNATEVYGDWKAGMDLSETFINSPVAMTNDKCVILCPDYQDATMKNHADLVNTMMGEVFDNINYYTDENARNSLASGGFTDCGMLFLNAHGSVIERSDNSKMLFFNIGKLEDEASCISYLENAVDGSQILWKAFHSKTENCHATIDTSIDNNGISSSTLRLSTRFLEDVLEGKTFDNTVVYLFVCYAFSDTYLLDLFFSHGASMVIGCHDTMTSAHSIMTVLELHDAILNQDEYGNYGKFYEGIDNTNIDTISKIVMCYGYSEEAAEEAARAYLENNSNAPNNPSIYTNEAGVFEVYDNYYTGYTKAIEEYRNISYTFRSPDHRDRVLHGEGNLTGYVLTQDGQPADGAMVTLYHWMDHNFKKYEHQAVADANGKYEFVDVPFGVYAIEAGLNGSVDYTTITIDEKTSEANTLTIQNDQVIVWGDAVWKPATSRENYSSYLVEPVLLESPNEQAIVKLSDDWKALMDVMEGQIDVVAGNSFSGSPFSGAANLTVDSVYYAGDVLSVRMSAISYAAGQAHPWRSGCTSNTFVSTGETAALGDLLLPGSDHTHIRNGWLSLLENVYDLVEPREAIVSKAMDGQLGSWALTPDGLELSFAPYEISSYSSYSGSVLVPYQELRGELKDDYIPPALSSALNPPTVSLADTDDSRFRNSDYQIWGNVTDSVIAFDGAANHVSICAVNRNSQSLDDSVLFYANTLTDALIWLPECESGLYRVRWIIGDTQSTTMIEIP